MACRQEGGKADLIRVVRGPDGVVALDPTGHAPGRGAYLHDAPECIDLARKRHALDHSLGTIVQPEVWAHLKR